MNVISKEMVEKLYDPKETGVLVIPEKVSESDLIELRRFIKEKENKFFGQNVQSLMCNNQRRQSTYLQWTPRLWTPQLNNFSNTSSIILCC